MGVLDFLFGSGAGSASGKRVEAPVGTVSETRRASSVPLVRRSRSRRLPSNRSYDAAGSDRATANWTSDPLSADEVIDRNHRPLVARSREQSRNNDYMKRFLRLCDLHIVGPQGFGLESLATNASGEADADARAAIEAWFAKWSQAGNCDVKGRRNFRRILKALVLSAARDGEIFVQEVFGRAAGPMGYALRVIDPQRCPVDYNVDRLPGGNMVRQGIEFDVVGRPVAYYFRDDGPGARIYPDAAYRLRRIPARNVIHHFVEDLLEQRRGIPWAATSLWRLHMLNGFEKASLSNARQGAQLTGFIEWEDGYGPEPDEDLDDEELILEPEGGTYQELPAGARVKNVNNNYPSGEFETFHKAMLRGAGAGMGVAYVNFANDLTGVNFSSIRQGVLDERDHWMDLQEWLVEGVLDRVFSRALLQSLLRGLVTSGGRSLPAAQAERFLGRRWQGRRWAWVDPQKDVQAEVAGKNNLLTSPSDIIRRRGQDPSAVWKAFAADIKAMEEAGIPDAYIMASLVGVSPPVIDPEGVNNETD